MFVDLLAVEGTYRGRTRLLSARRMSTKHWKQFFEKYEKFMDWDAKDDRCVTPAVLNMLKDLRDELNARGAPSEIVFFSDDPAEFFLGEGFLGFDVFGDFEESAIQEGNIIDEKYQKKLNENGLFPTFQDATDFCEGWKNLLALGNSPWEVEKNPRPFCIWLYRE